MCKPGLFFEKPPQNLPRHLFGLSPCLARRTHARGAAFLAGADVDRLQAVPEEVLLQVVKGGAQSDASGIIVVDEEDWSIVGASRGPTYQTTPASNSP